MNGPGSDPRAMRPREGASPSQNERIVWIAFLISPAIYVIVARMIVGDRVVPTEVPAWPFYAAGVLLTLAAVAAPRFIPKREPAVAELVPPERIVSWAFDESISIVGFVGVFLGGFPIATFILFALASMGLIWLHRPGD